MNKPKYAAESAILAKITALANKHRTAFEKEGAAYLARVDLAKWEREVNSLLARLDTTPMGRVLRRKYEQEVGLASRWLNGNQEDSEGADAN